MLSSSSQSDLSNLHRHLLDIKTVVVVVIVVVVVVVLIVVVVADRLLCDFVIIVSVRPV